MWQCAPKVYPVVCPPGQSHKCVEFADGGSKPPMLGSETLPAPTIGQKLLFSSADLTPASD